MGPCRKANPVSNAGRDLAAFGEMTVGRSSQRAERCPELSREDLRLLPGGEVSALVDLVEVGQGWVGLLDPAARGPDDLAGELRESDRDLDRWWSLAGRASRGLSALPVRPCRRGPGARQPVGRDVVEDVVPGEIARGLVLDKGARDLVVAISVVVEHPGRHGDR